MSNSTTYSSSYAVPVSGLGATTARESLLRRWIFPLYATFSLGFYSLRFLFGWGSAATTIYDSDMPAYLASVKDIVWVGFVLAAICSIDGAEAVRQVRKHRAFYYLLGLFIVWMFLCCLVHIIFQEEDLTESVLYNVRMPLEYIPAAVLAPAFIGSWTQLGKLFNRLNWLAIAFAVFEIVMVFSGFRHTGFDYGGFTIRFGGILGAPNDWGMYAGGAILAISALAKSRLQLIAFIPSLILSQSRSAILGMVAGAVPLLARIETRTIVRRILPAILLIVFLGYTFRPDGSPSDLVPDRVGVDASAVDRLDQFGEFATNFRNLDNLPNLIFGVRRFHIETFYSALVVRGGLPALLLYSTAIAWTIARGWRLRSSTPQLVALCLVLMVSVSSLFVPYPDVYPTNLYFWIAVGIVWMNPTREET